MKYYFIYGNSYKLIYTPQIHIPNRQWISRSRSISIIGFRLRKRKI